jgi:hypothetical protein
MPRTKKTAQPTISSAAPKSTITIRMYNPGFGDCFLLTFQTADGSPRYMLIDCGVHQRVTGGGDKMRLIVADIAKVTNNHLHIAAVTHEHADHISGFRQANDIFGKIKIDDLWLAWTEDPNDPLARQLKSGIKQGVEELTSAVAKLAPTNMQAANALQGILDFEVSANSLGINKSELDCLRDWSAKKLQKPEDYRRPGEDPLTIPGVNGIKVYVLGPPRDAASFNVTEKESEMYPEFAAIDASQAFTAALKAGESNLSREDENNIKRSYPFDKRFSITAEQAKTDPDYQDFFRDYYGFTTDITKTEAWRRIDDNWLDSAGELALKINNMTNNTSLVLAFELTDFDPQKVLLFVGDAQVGNWLSWPAVTFGNGTAGNEKITGDDLLHRTEFYKVGHHGSRNATLRLKGLELMNANNLVAMIPVDQKWANDVMHWEHPALKLLGVLEEKTKNRLLRTDKIASISEAIQKPDNIDSGEWQNFLKAVDWDKSPDNLWIQYTMEA